jgi:hypothetical protein
MNASAASASILPMAMTKNWRWRLRTAIRWTAAFDRVSRLNRCGHVPVARKIVVFRLLERQRLDHPLFNDARTREYVLKPSIVVVGEIEFSARICIVHRT